MQFLEFLGNIDFKNLYRVPYTFLAMEMAIESGMALKNKQTNPVFLGASYSLSLGTKIEYTLGWWSDDKIVKNVIFISFGFVFFHEADFCMDFSQT